HAPPHLPSFPTRRSSDLRLAALAPYLSPEARSSLEALGERPVRTVIVGSLTITEVKVGGLADPTEALATFETNYAEVDADGTERSEEHTSELQSPYDLVC